MEDQTTWQSICIKREDRHSRSSCTVRLSKAKCAKTSPLLTTSRLWVHYMRYWAIFSQMTYRTIARSLSRRFDFAFGGVLVQVTSKTMAFDWSINLRGVALQYTFSEFLEMQMTHRTIAA
eukprot:scaffold34612_cov165-Amphora_coffeaeformis.AAC.9